MEYGVDVAILGLALPLTMGIVELIKRAGVDTRWAGLLSLLIGIIVGVLIRVSGIGDGSLTLAGLAGAIAGLSAAGVWSGTKAVTTA